MKKRMVAGLLTIIMAFQPSSVVLASETDCVLNEVEMDAGEETVIEQKKDWKILYNGKKEAEIMMDEQVEEVEEEPVPFRADRELEALNASKYSSILPSTESVGKYGFRGDEMKLYFNLFCRGEESDKYYVVIRKGDSKSGGKKGKIVGHTEGNFEAEECLINMTVWLKTETLEAGTYTVETYMKYYSGGSYKIDSSTHYYFNIYIKNEQTPLNSISVDNTGIQMKIGDELALDVSYDPKATTEDTTVTWSNSNPTAVKVEEGYYKTQAATITALNYGTSYITAHMGDKTAVCIVTVSPEADDNFPFSDISIIKNNWRYESVKYVYDKGIMNGISGTSWFKPDDALTRGMFATVLYRMAGSPEITYTEKFSDVADGRYYSKAVIWANEKGIVSGFEDGTYGVDKNITREQIAKMLNEYAKVSGYDVSQFKELNSFTDADAVSGWAIGYMQWATAVGMISGKPNEDGSYRLDPKGEATRVECAKMLMMFDQAY